MLLAGGLTTSASADPINVGNLVNVNISNVANNNTITVPINAAANICGVDVDVLILALAGTGDQTFTTCRARGNQTTTVTG